MATHPSIPAWKNPDGGAWWATVQWVTKSWTCLSGGNKKKSKHSFWLGWFWLIPPKGTFKKSYCFSQLVAVNWGMWKFVQISMWKAPLKTELFERWRLTLVRSWLWLNGPTIVNKRSKMLKYCSWIYCIIICCIMTCSMHVLWGLFQTLVKILFGDTHSSLYKELGIELLKWYFWVQLS